MTYETVFAGQVDTLLEDQNTVIFDHRNAHSYAREHIPGAMQVTDENVGSLIKSKCYDRPILIYCYHGLTSRDLCQFFIGLGFSNVYNLEGGWQAWSAFRVPLQTAI